MATGDKIYNIFDKKVMSTTELQTRALDYLRGQLRNLIRRLTNGYSARSEATYGVQGQSVILANNLPTIESTPGPAVLEGAISGSGIDQVLIEQFSAIDGNGNFMQILTNTTIVFENTNSIDYWFASKYAEVVDDVGGAVIANPGIPNKWEYAYFKEEIGQTADPTLVLDDLDSTLTIVVDSVTEVAVSHAGQVIRVWLKDPVSNTTWFEDLTVQFGNDPDGPRAGFTNSNFIETVGTLGQGASPSLVEADYTIWQKGISWFRESTRDLGTDIGSTQQYEPNAQRQAYVVHGHALGAGAGLVVDLTEARQWEHSPRISAMPKLGSLPGPLLFTQVTTIGVAGDSDSYSIAYTNLGPWVGGVTNFATLLSASRYIEFSLLTAVGSGNLFTKAIGTDFYIENIASGTSEPDGAITFDVTRDLGSATTDSYTVRMWPLDMNRFNS